MTTGQKRNSDLGGPSLERSRVSRFLEWARIADAPLSIFLGLVAVRTVLGWSLLELLPPWAFDAFFVATMIFGVIMLISSPRIAILAGGINLVSTESGQSRTGRG